MSIITTLTNLFGRYSFDHHTDQALALTQPSATDAPAIAHADASPLRLVPPAPEDGPAAPTSRGAAGHPTAWPIDWDQTRDDLATLRILCGALADTCADVIECIDDLDPTPAGLAQAAADART